MEKCWLTVGEGAAMISVHKKSLYSLIAKGEIPHSRRSGIGIRIHIDALDAYLREGEVKSVKEQIERVR
jgi:excisionase family DNA binding protein